jgi:hypothetical protein
MILLELLGLLLALVILGAFILVGFVYWLNGRMAAAARSKNLSDE